MSRWSFRNIVSLSFCAVAFAILVSMWAVGNAAAAVIPVPQEGPCELAFVANPSVLLESEFVKLSGMFPRRDPKDPEAMLLYETESVRGVLALPDDLTLFTDPRKVSKPVQYYIEYTLKSDSKESPYHEYVKQKKPRPPNIELISEEQERLIYAAEPLVRQFPGDAEPVEVLPGYQIVFEGKKITVASNGFRYDPQNLPAMTESVSKLFQENSRSDGFVAFDSKSARKLIESVVRDGKDQLPPMAAPYLEMPARIDLITASIEIDKTASATVRAECVRAEDAEQLAKMIGELVTMAKLSNQAAGPSAEMFAKVLDTVKSKATGRQVEATVEVTQEAAEQSRLAAGESQLMNNQRQAALSMHNFESAYGGFPFQPQEGQSDEISWRVRVLPFLDQQELYGRFDLSQPWDSPENLKLLDEMPMPPVFGGIEVFGQTGTKTNLCWVKSGVTGFPDLKNGTSNTICFVHSAKSVNWTENNDVTPVDVVAQFKALKPGEYLTATFYDGSVRNIPAETDPEKFLKMLDTGMDK